MTYTIAGAQLGTSLLWTAFLTWPLMAAVQMMCARIGVGFLAIPTLAGASAYAFAETFAWRQGLDQKLHRARAFYGTLICSILVGIGLSFTSIGPMDALFLTAVINGILAPFLLLVIFM